MRRSTSRSMLALPAVSLLMVCGSARAADLVRMQVDAGKLVFATTCTTCHGSEGKGGTGPKLQDRDLPLATLASTILNGRPGTAMPPFKDVIDEKSRADVLAYVQWLATGGRLPTAIVTAESFGPASAAPARAAPSDQPIAVGDGHGVPARGAALFFDPTNLSSCRGCHSYADKGGPVGPDLSTLNRAPLEIYQSITAPKVWSSSFPGVTIELHDGTRITGIKADETSDAVGVFDVSAIPPIRRTVMKSDIVSLSDIKDAGIYDHTRLPFAKQDWLDLSAYLGH